MEATIDHPDHYTSGPAKCECGRIIECIQVVEHMDFCLGNVLKYVWRAGKKGPALEDLRKARWYLDRAIGREMEKNEDERLAGKSL